MIKFSDNIRRLSRWHLISSSDIGKGGSKISSEDIDINNWYPSEVPSTVLATLVENGVYKDPYFGTNLSKIPTEQFKIPWWYRTEFAISEDQAKQVVLLAIDGINYKANIWLNGELVVDEDVVCGAYRRFQFNISSHLKIGNNVIAIEVFPPKPGDFTIGFVDWNPNPPDNNIGIFKDQEVEK